MRHRLKCIIVKHHSCDHHDKEHEDDEDVVVESRIATPHGEHKVKFDLPYEQTANALMSAKGYSEYVKKHGYHFTDALAEHVSKMMENANGQQHTCTVAVIYILRGKSVVENSKRKKAHAAEVPDIVKQIVRATTAEQGHEILDKISQYEKDK